MARGCLERGFPPLSLGCERASLEGGLRRVGSKRLCDDCRPTGLQRLDLGQCGGELLLPSIAFALKDLDALGWARSPPFRGRAHSGHPASSLRLAPSSGASRPNACSTVMLSSQAPNSSSDSSSSGPSSSLS